MNNQDMIKWEMELCNEQYSGNLKELMDEIRELEGR